MTGVPRDAGLFVAVNRKMAERILAFGDPNPFVVAMIGCAGLPVESVPVERSERPAGGSAYSSWGRIRAGLRAVACARRLRRRREGGPAAPPPEIAPIRALFGGPFRDDHPLPR